MWEQVCLLVLAELVGQGGLGLWGDWGPLQFSPQQSRSQVFKDLLLHRLHHHYTFNTMPSTPSLEGPALSGVSSPVWGSSRQSLTMGSWFFVFNFTSITREVVVMVEEEDVKVPRNNAKPLTPCNWEWELRERWLGRWRPCCGFRQVTPVWGTHLRFGHPQELLWLQPSFNFTVMEPASRTLLWPQLQPPRAAQLLL